MTDIMEQIKELTEKANRYENVKKRYMEQASKIQQAIDILQKVANEIDPLIGVKRESKQRSGTNYNEIYEQIFGLMNAGTHINFDLIEKTYSLDHNQVAYIVQMLRKDKRVGSRMEGHKKFYFIERET